MPGPLVVRLDGVSKAFRRHPSPGRRGSLKADLAAILRGERTALRTVLSGVDLGIHAGDAVALLGPNGCGKSTLLRLIAGIYRPDAGRVCTRGRIATLLELGVGFHDDLDARDNVLVNATLLGLGRRAALARLDAILDFAELRDRAHEPLRTFSSGMVVRLGFSTAVHLDPDVLLVDEVLSVGDVDFRHRSLERVIALRDAGCTIVFASHEPTIVERIATRVALLEDGKVHEDDDAQATLSRYFASPRPPRGGVSERQPCES